MTLMNKFSQFLLAAVLGLLSTAASAALVTLQPSASSITTGQQFTLDVLLQDPFAGHEAGDELLAFGFNVDYDAAAFSLLSSVAGPLWVGDSEFTGLDLSGWAFPGIQDTGGPILLGQLTFAALGTGSFAFGISGDPGIDLLQGLYYASGDMQPLSAVTSLEVTAPTPVPAPPVVLLLGGGLLALARQRRGKA